MMVGCDGDLGMQREQPYDTWCVKMNVSKTGDHASDWWLIPLNLKHG